MRLVVINPNSTAAMTATIATSARAAASAGTEIVAVNPPAGPVSIEGQYDAALSLPGVLEEVRRGERQGADGFVIACFDDVGIDACREIATGPVLGICEAAMHAAAMLATNFTVLTTLPRVVSHIEHLARHYGFARQCRAVRAVDIAVLDLADSPLARQSLLAAARQAEAEGSEAIILGCAGMTDLTLWLRGEVGVPVVDGVTIAVRMVEALVGAGLQTSKVRSYALPRRK